MNKAESILLESIKSYYHENSIKWCEFKVCDIPYRVSELGVFQTRRISGHGPHLKLGDWRSKATSRGTTDKHGGYYLVSNIGSLQIRMHRLIIVAFSGAIPKEMEVNHKNGKRDDNSLANLEVVTHKRNMEGMSTSHIVKRKNKGGKITQEALDEIQRRINLGYTNKDIADYFNVDPSNISKIRHGHWFKIYGK